MSWTSPQDVLDRWVGNDKPTDEDLIQALIDDAETIILSEYPGIQARIDDESLSIAVVKMVVARMTTRILRNPENLTYWQQNTGPFGQSRGYGAGNSNDIWLSDNELTLLAPKSRGKAYEINQGIDAQSPEVIDEFRLGLTNGYEWLEVSDNDLY
jgi:hypothetical protein